VPIISAEINIPIKIGAITCARNTMIAIIIIRVITAIIIAPTTLSVTPPSPPGIPNRCYVTLYSTFRLGYYQVIKLAYVRSAML
jgi:hypothetical protein